MSDTVFLSGSRKITRLNDAIRTRIKNMVDAGMNIVIGDASGADRVMQEYLNRVGCRNVTVYCAGDHCRNNIGRWVSRFVQVDPKLRGRDFFSTKDRAMAALADFGFVVWDGKSTGSITNVGELVDRGKKVVIYYSPENGFCTISNKDQFQIFLGKKCDPKIHHTIKSGSENLSKSGTPSLQASMVLDR